jgi:Tol biopolymer transport system component
MKKLCLLLLLANYSVVYANQWANIDNLQLGKLTVKRLVGESNALHLSESKDGQKIAYVRHWTSVWMADANGENKSKIVGVTDSLNVFANPTWSPDSKYVVYAAGIGHTLSGGKTSLWLINVQDKQRKQLFAGYDLNAFDKTYPTWSPDGKKLAVNAIVDGREELIIGDIFDTASVSLMNLGMQKVGSISWMKNGKHILVQGDSHEKGNFWLVNIESLDKSAFDSGGIEGKYAEFSPDGQWLCFQSDENTTYIVTSKGGPPKPLFEGELLGNATGLRGQDLGSKWGWDGNSLLLAVVPQKESERNILGVVDTSGANLQVIFEPELGQKLDFRPEWSPDEKFIAFAVADGENATIHTIELHSKKPKKIADGRNPTWSPYMDEIAFARGGNIWVKSLETGIESQVTLNLEDAGAPQWSPLGDVICFRNNGLWIVSSLGGEPSLFAEFGGAFNWSADGKRGWAHNNRSNIYNGIWGDTWEYLLEDAPRAGRIWGGSQGHVPYVASDGSFVVSFNWMEEGGIIIQRPDSEIGKIILKEYDGLRPSWCTVSPSGSRIAFFLVEPWEREIWKIDISDLLADSVVP